MAFTIVQIFLTLLLAAHVCMCTKPDLSRISTGVVRQRENLNKPAFLSLATDVRDLAPAELRTVYSQPEVARSKPTDNEGSRKKRSVTNNTYRIDITDTINSLRSYAGASDMNYLTRSFSLENDVANWTSYCDYDATLYEYSVGYAIKSVSASQPNYVSALEIIFNSSDFYYALRSVELQTVAAAYSYCSSARVNGKDYANVYLSTYAFSNTSNFNSSVQQYTLGEACTTCRSGKYWCYQGLCEDYCPASDSNCDCNSYCLNCATTNKTTCSCLCLEGWTGSRCESSVGTNATVPSCITTPRIPITWTTKPTTTKAPTTTSGGKNLAPIGKSMIQLALYTTMVLFMRL